MDEARIRKLATFFVSFAVSALLSDALIQLIPETFADPGFYHAQYRGYRAFDL